MYNPQIGLGLIRTNKGAGVSLSATISGTAIVSFTLTCVASGFGTPSYQWKRGGSNISGATSSTYTLVAADSGTAITCYVSEGALNATSNTLNVIRTILDEVSGTQGADGLLLLKGSYYGSNALRGRRSSDNTESNFGFLSTGALDTSSILTFGGGSNMLKYSEDFSQAYWGKNDITLGTSATNPTGFTSAVKLEETATTNSHYTAIATGDMTEPGRYCVSFRIKKAERNWVKLIIYNGVEASGLGVFFNLNLGTVGTSDTGCTGTISDAGNGFYLCSVSRFITGSAGASCGMILSTDGSTLSYAGTAGSGVYFTGAQLNGGFSPITYLQTTSAAVSGHVYCTTLYAQDGSGINKTQTTAASQPKIMFGGAIVVRSGIGAFRPMLAYDGVDDFMTATNGIGSAANMSIYNVYTSEIAAASDTNSAVTAFWGNAGITDQLGIIGNTGALSGEYIAYVYTRGATVGRAGSTTYRRPQNKVVLESSYWLATEFKSRQNAAAVTLDLTSSWTITGNSSPSNCTTLTSRLSIGASYTSGAPASQTPILEGCSLIYLADKTSSNSLIESFFNSYYELY